LSTQKTNNWLKILQDNGYRITKPMKIIVDILATSDHLLNPTEVYLQAKNIYSKVGLVTVYRTMEKMEQAELIERVHMPDGCQSFFQSSNGHQHLMICTSCGRAHYFEGENLNQFFQSIGNKFGYSVNNHWLQLFGRCEDCQENKKDQSNYKEDAS
jgi:Fe2+ or Zn2+ uptake regulation protein